MSLNPEGRPLLATAIVIAALAAVGLLAYAVGFFSGPRVAPAATEHFQTITADQYLNRVDRICAKWERLAELRRPRRITPAYLVYSYKLGLRRMNAIDALPFPPQEIAPAIGVVRRQQHYFARVVGRIIGVMRHGGDWAGMYLRERPRLEPVAAAHRATYRRLGVPDCG